MAAFLHKKKASVILNIVNQFSLAIPNMEIRKIFTTKIMDFFKENVPKDGETLKSFCKALKEGNSGDVERMFGDCLRRTISIRDTFVKKQVKENFYHGILLGIIGFQDTWGISSNKESGNGYSDILVEIDDEGIGIIVEVKYAQDGNMETASRKALEQIELLQYEEQLHEDGIHHILKYGIACYKKKCRVLLADEK